jgi:hypothetical protein
LEHQNVVNPPEATSMRVFYFMTSVLSVVVLPTAVAAQSPTVQTLSRPAGVFPEPFTRIVGVRELSDGRTLIADRTEQHVSFLDFAAGTLERVGHEGGGPGEYQTPTGLLPLPNDETMLVDFGNMRTSRITARGVVEDGFPMLQGSGNLIIPAGVDARGAVYHSSAGMFTMRTDEAPTTSPDSAAVSRWDPETGASTTVAWLKVTPLVMTRQGPSFQVEGSRAPGLPTMRPFSPRDAWAVAPDGRVAVARAEGYRLDWVSPNGSVQAGPPVDYEPVRITKAEKEAWADAQSRRVMSMRLSGGGGQTMTLPKPDIDQVDFPETMPPFDGDAVSVTPFGEVWVQRSQPASETRPLFDVFDDGGRRVKQVRLPSGRSLVGFGASRVYAVNTDDDGLQWLERYKYP